MSSPRRSVLLAVGVLLVAGGAVWYAFFRQPVPPPEPPDIGAAFAANMRGVGHMEKFEYSAAVEAFQEALAKNPTWVDAKINLAIALLNHRQEELAEPVRLLEGVLAEQPDNIRARYTLGMLREHMQQPEQAYPHFLKVSELDPGDAHSWLHLGVNHAKGDLSEEARTCFRKALELDPNLNEARHRLAGFERGAKRKQMNEEIDALRAAFWERQTAMKYYLMGPHAEVRGRTKESHPPQPIGPLPAFMPWEELKVTLAEGARWASAADLGNGPTGDLRRKVRERFGATVALFDYNRDDKPDVLLLAAVVQEGKVRDLLLRNDGDGNFVDVTQAAGLAGFASLGVAIADYDNDYARDLVLTGIGTQRLLRNTGKGTFEDMTTAAGLDKVGGVCLGCGWLDVDQDSDLDLFLCRLADTPEAALQALNGTSVAGGRMEVFANAGNAVPVPDGQPMPPLKTAFKREAAFTILVQGSVTMFLASDLDADRDADLLFLADGQTPHGIRNDRLLRFQTIKGLLLPQEAWNGGLVLDINHDGRSDLVLLAHNKKPTILLSKGAASSAPPETWFEQGSTNAPPLKHATMIDIDADGWADVVGLAADRQAVLLHNDGEGKLVSRPEPFGVKLPTDLLAVTSAHLDSDCTADVLLWSEKEGLKVYRGVDNGNKSLALELSGRFEKDATRTNLDGLGVKTEALAGKLWTTHENTTLSAGLGQSRLPIRLGVGKAASADVLRILWPDGIPQAELNVPACRLLRQREQNRIPTSCPVIMTWDGTQYVHLTDCLGGGALGETGADGSVRPPRPEESIKIEASQLQPKDGKLLLKITEPMDELTYLDRVQLLAIDHPREVRVYPDERFATSGPQPTQDLLLFRQMIFPKTAMDHHGRDVAALLATLDKKFVTDFAKSTWMGYAEDHYVELDFADRLALLKPGQKVYLVAAGWTDYAYPETIYAATQAGVPTNAPMLERQAADGSWKPVLEIGFPAGMPRVMTVDVSKLLEGPTCKIRLRTNLQVYWDQLSVGVLEEVAAIGKQGPATVTALEVQNARLAARGFLLERRPYGKRGPVEYDDARTEIVPATPWKGRLTKLGDVTPLLHKDDDQFVLCGPGDEITIAFDATQLPPLRDGLVRSYVLKTWGYCKDTAPTTATGGHVEPLPFRGMKTFPFYDAADKKRAAELQDEYRKKWNSRLAPGGE